MKIGDRTTLEAKIFPCIWSTFVIANKASSKSISYNLLCGAKSLQCRIRIDFIAISAQAST
jgi:hypothetical protein